MELLKTLLLVYAGILLLNVAFSAYCLFSYKDPLYRYSLYLWTFTFFHTLVQGIFQSSHLSMVLALSTSFASSLVLVQILSFVTQIPFPVRAYSALMAVSLALAALASWSGQGFVAISLPVAASVAFPLLHSAAVTYMTARSRTGVSGIKALCLLLVVNALHMLDYPFLRLDPALSLPGFSIALGLLMATSIFLPSFIIRNISDRYSSKISELNHKLVEYQNQMTEMVSLAHLGELSFGFVHDMASPTSLLLHYSREISTMHQDGVRSGEEMLRYIKGIERATSGLVKMQNLFRAMVKSKKETTDLQEIDLNETLRACAELFSPFLDRYKIAINLNLPADPSVVRVPPGLPERVLLNLLQNAVNALVGCKIRRIELSVTSVGDAWVVIVRDSGTGIPADRLENLWEKFGHSDTARKHSAAHSGGSGFGLYKVKQLITSIHGRIRVDTSSNGTTFTIELPKAASAESVFRTAA